jgi:hypothetical protein
VSRRRGLLGRVVTNRTDPRSRWVTIADMWTNAREIVYAWTHRVPDNSIIKYRNGKIIGHSVRYRRR